MIGANLFGKVYAYYVQLALCNKILLIMKAVRITSEKVARLAIKQTSNISLEW